MSRSTSKWLRTFMIIVMIHVLLFSSFDFSKVSAAEGTTITSIAPTTATTIAAGLDGGVGFTFPNFNNGASFESVRHDIDLLVNQDGDWISIDNNAASGWVYDDNFGNFWDGPGGYWFNPVEETMQLRVASKANPEVFAEYTFTVAAINEQEITSMAPAGPTTLQVSPSGGTGFEFPRFNSGATFRDVRDDVALFVQQGDEWVSIDNNADSGWIYDNNFGNWWEGPGGYWFDPVEETTKVRVASKSNPDVFVEYTLVVTLPVRNSHTITNFDGRATHEADDNGAVGLPMPRIDGGYATKSEIDNFVYEVKVDGEWVNIQDSATSGISYSANGYNRNSSATQWGFWTDHIFGIWFQPLQEDVELRIGYPENGERDGDIGSNYVEYRLIGNPDAFRPDEVVLDDIEIGTSEDPALDGWDLRWNDEFEGTELDTEKWNYDIGYYLDDTPKDWGWGNQELQHYTDSENNLFVEDGKLNIVAFEDPKSFPQDPDRIAPYSSGKVTTQDKFAFTYGRVDFRAKLPAVTGAWPALWMMPNDNVYGTWAASGEIDVMEAKGRVPGASSGAIHFGGEHPSNTYIHGDYTFEEGERIDTDFHVYSVIWEPDMISWYVDGNYFFSVPKEQWFSSGMRENPYAPFDQDFYLIMNLAVGGWFDGGRTPDAADLPMTMEVDYVRVYEDPNLDDEGFVYVPAEGVEVNRGSVELTTDGQRTTLSATVAPTNATNKRVTWSSSDESVATVSANGTVTAVANGTATITATTVDGGYVATSTVTVDIIPQLTLDETFPLKNGTFTDGLNHWTTSSTIETTNRQAVIQIPASESAELKQSDLALLEGKDYLVSFDASSTIEREIELVVIGDERLVGENVSVSSDKKRHSFSFTALADEEVEVALLFADAGHDAHEVTIDNVMLEVKNPDKNKVKNHSFADDNASWELWSDVGATSNVADGVNTLTIPSLGNEFWSIQFSQAGLALEQSKSYRLVFDMSSSIGRKLDTILESTNYDKYVWETLEVNEEMNTYALEFTHTSNTDPAAKLVLALGKVEGQEAIGEHTVKIDNVYLYEIPATLNGGSDEPEEPVTPRDGYGIVATEPNTAEFYFNDAPWAIVHFSKNGEALENIRMIEVAENYSILKVEGIEEGDIIRYGFTYGITEGGEQAEHPARNYVHTFSEEEDPEDSGNEDEDNGSNNPGTGNPGTPAPPGPTPTPEPAPIEADEDGNVTYEAQPGEATTIPAAVGQSEDVKQVVVEQNGLSVKLPVSVLKSLSTRGDIVLHMEENESTSINGDTQSKSPIFSFNLSVKDAQGNLSRVTSFDEPLVVSIEITDVDGNEDLFGIYRINGDNTLTYVGGTRVGNYMEVGLTSFSNYGVFEYTKLFTDVPNDHWAFTTVHKLASMQVVNGVTDTTFNPSTSITRAEFAALIARALDLQVTGSVTFKDVSISDWFAREVQAAANAGIVNGYDATTFAPHELITREEMAAMIVRAHKHLHGDTDVTSTDATFNDSEAVSPWAKDYVQLASDLSLVQGRANAMFAPKDHATRAENSQIIYNLLLTR